VAIEVEVDQDEYSALDESWRDEARCRGLGFDIFFSSDPFDRMSALAYCRQCPVRLHCADAAVANGEEGIWGGLTQEEREDDSAPLAG
jgi:WhiB family redox-sensing transcriptional regulator